MNTDNFKCEPSPDELQGELKDTVHLIRTSPLPEESRNRALRRALQWANGLPAPSGPLSPAHRNKRPRWFRWTFLGSATALLIALACVFFWQAGNPAASWAEVVKALQMKPWIHAIGAFEGGVKQELWFSQKQEVFTQTTGGYFKYYDRKSHFIDEYNSVDNRLIRKSDSSSDYDQRAFVDLQEIFVDLSIGKSPSPAAFANDLPMVGQSMTEIERDGRKLAEHCMKFRKKCDGSVIELVMVFHVDPSTNLPTAMIEELSGNVGERTIDIKIAYQFEYPSDGPADIYALGVPASVQRIDRTPKPELSQLISAVTKSRNDFDPYEAVVIDGVRSDLYTKIGVYHHIWRKRAKFRAEQDIPLGNDFAELPLQPSDNLDWCRKYFDKHRHEPVAVCNGKTVYVRDWDWKASKANWENPKAKDEDLYRWKEESQNFNHYGDGINKVLSTQARDFFVELYAYPFIQYPSADVEVEMKPADPEDPPGTILIEERFSTKDSVTARVERFVVDPSRGFVALRHEIDFLEPESKEDAPQTFTDIDEMKAFFKSPQGIWYPTQVHHSRRHNSPTAPQKIEFARAHSFYLDFSKELPDEIFRPDFSSHSDSKR